MHFQTDRISVKILMSLSVTVLVLTGCTSAKYQQMQHERDIRREAYEDARGKVVVKRSRDFLSNDMLGKWQFLELVVEERGGSEDILKVKAERTARRLKGLRLRFRKNGDNYAYRVENVMEKSHGTYTTRSVHGDDTPQSGWLQFYPISGSQIPDLIFDFAKGTPKQVLLGDGEVDTTRIGTKIIQVSIKETRLDLTLDLGMVLAPDGWLHRGNIRCSFERLE